VKHASHCRVGVEAMIGQLTIRENNGVGGQLAQGFAAEARMHCGGGQSRAVRNDERAFIMRGNIEKKDSRRMT
jgi:hypothetical protein